MSLKRVLLLVLILSCLDVLGQSGSTSKFDLGIKGGVNLAGIAGEYSRDIKSLFKVSLNGGGFASYPIFRDELRIQAEVLFSAKGYKASVTDSVFLSDITHNLYYLDLPLVLNYSLGSGWDVHLGVQYSFLLFEQYVNFDPDRKELLKVSDSDLGIAVGFSYDIDERTKAGFRYIHGIEDAYDFSSRTGHNILFQIYFSYNFL